MNPQNYIQISGRLVADAKPNSGKTYARFSIAHNFGQDTPSLFMNCVVFQQEFEKNKQSIPWDLLSKGTDILLTGRLRPNNWTDDNGVERRGIDIIVDKIRANDD